MASSNKIFLIGFMGSGKTTLGKELAKKLDKPFFDLDLEIEKAESLSVNQIFERHGEAYFRDIESKVLQVLIANNSNFVLALGGGTPCFNGNMDLVNSAGISIYLKYNAGILTSRLLNAKSERPLIRGLNKLQLKEFVTSKLEEREFFYDQATCCIEKASLMLVELIELLNL
ncbi:shikimate kinase [Vicingaceae bacterium]|nr:shikimate kinase [Vicingaceae bacterium]